MKLNWKLFAPLVVAILVWLIGAPEGLSANSWIYVSIFAGLVVGLILEPMPPAFIGIIAVTVSMLFKVGPAPVVDKATGVAKAITDAQAISWGLSGFSNAIVWLIFAAFMIGIGYENSGLGRRIALFLVAKLGKVLVMLSLLRTLYWLHLFQVMRLVLVVPFIQSYLVFVRCLTPIQIRTLVKLVPI